MEKKYSKINVGANESDISIKPKTASAPVCSHLRYSKETTLKTQISAPSYFFSLKENDAPPFTKACELQRPKLLLGTIMNEDEAIAMIAASDIDHVNGLKKFLGDFLVDKKIIVNYNLSEKPFLINLLLEVIDYGAQRDCTVFKLACLITIYLSSHVYFKCYYWLSPDSVWSYFKELMILHTTKDSPDGQDIFDPDESYDIMSHFHTVYLTNLPLVHILSFGTYRLKFLWPFKPK